MLRTSILDQLSAGLCHAVTGRDDAVDLLDRLARESLFVTPLDDRNDWHRYHHLFAELLRAQLERRAPETVDDLHRRAAAWYGANGDGERAVRHAVAAGDADAVADLAAATCDAFINAGQNERARQMLESFSDEQLRAHPALAITAGALANYLPDPRVQRWAQLAGRMTLDDGPTPVGAASLRSWQAAWRASLARDGVTRMLQDATLACELETGNPEWSWLVLAQMMQCMALYLSGRVQRALQALDALTQSTLGHPDEECWALGLKALIAADQGRWDDAVELDRWACEKTVECEQLPPILAHALVLAHRDDPNLAECLEKAERDIREFFSPTQWRMILTAVVFAGIALGRGDLTAAERWTAEAESILAGFPDAGVLWEPHEAAPRGARRAPHGGPALGRGAPRPRPAADAAHGPADGRPPLPDREHGQVAHEPHLPKARRDHPDGRRRPGPADSAFSEHGQARPPHPADFTRFV